MIPKLLKIKGLYSYKDTNECVINFDALNQAGLFGIFGATGSGKSTIPEAMLLALYDETIRLSGRSSDGDLMNLDSSTLRIDFEFENDGQLYRRVVEGRRQAKNRVVKIDKPLTYRWESGKWTPLSIKSTKDLLGLNIEEFTKTVIIPQDKFRDFIELKDRDRVGMLSELFDLKRFNLFDKANSLLTATKIKITDLEGQLVGIGLADTILLAQLEQSLSGLMRELATLNEIIEQHQLMKNLFQEFNKIEKDLAQSADYLHTINNQIAENETFIQNKKSEFEDLKNQYDNRQTLLDTAQDIRAALKIGQWQTEISTHTDRLNNGRRMLSEEEQHLAAALEDKAKAEKDYTTLYANRPDFEQLNAVRAWFNQADTHHREAQRLTAEKEAIEARLEADNQAARSQFVEIKKYIDDAPFFEKMSDGILFIKKQEALFKQKQTQLDELLVKLKTKEKLKAFADALIEGEPCPLCGATHHPSVWTPESVAHELASTENERTRLTQKRDTLANIESRLTTLHKGSLDAHEALATTARSLKLNAEQQAAHLEQFYWSPPFSPTDRAQFEAAEKAATQFNAQLNTALEVLKKTESQVKIRQDKIQKYQKGISDIQSQIAQRQVGIDTIKTTLTQPDRLNEWLHLAPSDLENMAQDVDNQYKTIVQSFENINEIFEQRQKDLAQLRGGKAAATLQIEQLQTQAAQLKSTIAARSYDATAHADALTQHEHLQRQIGATTQSIEDTKYKIERRQSLEKELDNWRLREQHLREIVSLFRADGFTGYVAHTFLKNICEVANQWFLRFTKYGLQLEVDDYNRLQVRDMLNRGMLRSIDSLSGGQKFQAALALAVALSDTIQSRGGGIQRFFFLDEGFGSLDRDALRVVFDTLHILREKGRIVGVISHVEEMQQEISAYLRVQFTPERGSFFSEK